MRTRRQQRGFTLVEMMVAVLVGALSVIVAAKVAQVVLRQNAEGQQATDFNSRARLLGRQIRSDLRSAGLGSTGAIAVAPLSAPWSNGMGVATPNNRTALAAVTGANNLPAQNVGGVGIQPGSDAMMVVVPNAGLQGLTQGWNGVNGTAINLAPLPRNPAPPVQPLQSCMTGMIYVVDHTAPSGAGRVQLMVLNNVAGDVVTTNGPLLFTLAPGSSVFCARLSTYWIDVNGWLHRTDFGPGANPVNIGQGVWVDANQVGNDLMAPGLFDLQIAYRFSSELYLNQGMVAPGPGNLPAQWGYEGVGGNVNAMLGNPLNWFEVRRVRINLLMSTLRRVDEVLPGQKEQPAREDGQIVVVNRPLRVEWLTTSETLTNLRFFDFGAPQGVTPEPF